MSNIPPIPPISPPPVQPAQSIESAPAHTAPASLDSPFLPHEQPTKSALSAAAKLKAMRISDQSICRSQHWTSEQWIAVQADPEFQSHLETELANQEISAPMRDVSWDSVEQAGLRQTLNALNSGFVDPDFALRAAVAANKAVRSNERQQSNQTAQAIANTQIVINVSDLLRNSMRDIVDINAIQKPVFEVTPDMRKVHNGLPTDELMRQAALAEPHTVTKVIESSPSQPTRASQIDLSVLDTPVEVELTAAALRSSPAPVSASLIHRPTRHAEPQAEPKIPQSTASAVQSTSPTAQSTAHSSPMAHPTHQST